MKKTILYKYLGTNGTLETEIHLEGIYAIKHYVLEADEGKILTNGKERRKSVKVLEDEVATWKEMTPVGNN